jgi:2-polyprenyl-3-methyl-5-hydroxy-6-metoxy-1,4-benzoquinol methylase
MLPRVNKVLGFLKSICFENLLDVGSGRGVFLLSFLDEFPYIQVKSIDILDKRIELLSDLANGGIENLSVDKADLCAQPYKEKSFDVVTLLEVLEHIPNVEMAIKSAVKMAKKYVVVTVPSKEDDNPEHIHLLTKEKLTSYFTSCGIERLSFDGVPGHLFMIAKIKE